VESLIALDRLPTWLKPTRAKPTRKRAKPGNHASTKRVSQQRNNKRRRPKG
jgi:hypothetical protein